MTLSRRRSRGGLEKSVSGSAADEVVPESERGQAGLDAQRGFQAVPESERGQAGLDAQRGFRPKTESGRARLDREPRVRPEPRWGRNDPERPIGYDPERWAGFEPEDLAGGPGLLADGLDGAGPEGAGPEGAGVEGAGVEGAGVEGPDGRSGSSGRSGAARGKGFGSQRRFGRESGKRSGLGSGRRSDRPKKPRPERTPEERAQQAARRRERAASEVAADPTAAAKSVVLRQLTMGPRTRAQLQAAMARKDIPEDVANAVLDRFEEVDLIDDQEFSRQWVQSRHLGRGLAPRALAHELRQRGIAEETVKDAVEKVTPDDELTAARELVRRKAATMRNDDPQRRIRRLAGMLARKGYGGGVAMQAIREELADEADEAGLEFPEDEDPDLG